METKRWIKYWRNSLSDATRTEINLKNVTLQEPIGQHAFHTGMVGMLTAASFFKSKTEAPKKAATLADEAPTDLPVLICPIIILPNVEHGSAVKPFDPAYPFWIPASLSTEGVLSPPKDPSFPLVPRSVLEPLFKDDQVVVISSVDKIDEAIASTEPDMDSWPAYMSFCRDFFYAITGCSLDTYTFGKQIVKHDYIMIVDDSVKGASEGIINLYDQLFKESSTPVLFSNFTRFTPAPLHNLLSGGGFAAMAKSHLGQMGSEFGLSDSQRQAFYHFLSMNEGHVLAVNGPPGTGKTTLLQTVIANQVVESALIGKHPFVSVATSTNNQAITNIIETFGQINSGESSLSGRWLPEVSSYALYLPSGGIAPKAGIMYAKMSEGDNLMHTKFETKEYYMEAKNYFLDRCSFYAGQHFSDVSKAVKFLHGKLDSITRKIQDTINEYIPVETHLHLDTTLRYQAFQLATHYWEGRWLNEVEVMLESTGTDKFSEDYRKARWRRYAMLTPCFVGTFFMLPKFFTYSLNARNGWLPLWHFIDLLIVDEAGQVSPEVGAASFALAKKAIVVGDVYQIEPVWNIPRPVDIANMNKEKLIMGMKDQAGIDDIVAAGYAVSSGSIMKMAQLASPYKLPSYPERGMLLSEHRRCYDEIISYCNELAYKGSLIPKRGKRNPDTPLPPLGFAHISSQSQTAAGSRFNPKEAKTIAGWLLQHKDELETYYKKAIDEIVGIITPFSAQSQTIRRALKAAGLKADAMKIGTVHALQGAERPVIIFSSVYGQDDKGKRLFFDDGINMLNVAVSRAKDSFLLFGDMNIFKLDSPAPSGMLARYMQKTPDSRIKDVPDVK